MTQKICLASVLVDDIQAASEFYIDKLGFELRDAPHPPTVLPLISDGIPLVINQVLGAAKNSGSSAAITLAIETNDIQSTMNNLKAKGVKFTSDGPERFPVGLRAGFHDPAGNALELIQWD